MSKKIEVNGCFIDKAFFKENLEEAKQMKWTKAIDLPTNDHSHCIICNVPIKQSAKSDFYISGHCVLCGFCFKEFLSQESLNNS